MPNNFEYISDVMDRVIEKELEAPSVTNKIKAEVAQKSRKLIGGFRVHDHIAEAREIDKVVAAKKTILDKFRKDREMLQRELADLDIKPLAIVPAGAWYMLAKAAGLYTMHPDKDGKVGLHNTWYTGIVEAKMHRLKHSDLLKNYFPDQVSVDPAHRRATLILPDPPKDVTDILIKAQKRKLSVSAVAEAISFAETPHQLWQNRGTPKDIWAREQGYADYADWVKRDPIVFTEEGNAAAIIAQFGDFPIEKELVDKAIDADSILAMKPGAVNDMVAASTQWITLNPNSIGGLSQVQLAQQAQYITYTNQTNGVLGYSGYTSSGTANVGGQSVPIQSASWTGRS